MLDKNKKVADNLTYMGFDTMGFSFRDEGKSDDKEEEQESFSSIAAESSKNESAAVKESFPEITQALLDTGSDTFDDPSYYKTLLKDSGDEGKRLHTIFQKYLQAKDPKDKTVFRQQIINPYWDFYLKVAKGTADTLSEPEQFLLRFGMLYPNALSPETRTLFSRINVDSGLNQSVYYIDEWFGLVGRGEIKASVTDEAKPTRGGSDSAHLRAIMEKARGKYDGTRGLVKSLDDKRKGFEENLKNKTDALLTHRECAEIPEMSDCYTDSQRNSVPEIQETLKSLLQVDRNIKSALENLKESKDEFKKAEDKFKESSAAGAASVDLQAIVTEFNSLRQMAKMTIGRQGNAFPFLTSDYFHSLPDGIAFKENVIKKLAWIESIDCEVFQRVYKSMTNRIVPYVLLVPTYGDFGVCWEPFDKMNKTTSRGRVAIPMYPKNLTIAVLTAIADFRWQVAKENASFYWMEEGLTGNYYQWIQSQKLKGDLKMFFIQDYIAWMTKEAEGTQKLEKEVRGIFWRYLPFAQSLKDKLKDRNMIYLDLYQRDKNRMMSDGY